MVYAISFVFKVEAISIIVIAFLVKVILFCNLLLASKKLQPINEAMQRRLSTLGFTIGLMQSS